MPCGCGNLGRVPQAGMRRAVGPPRLSVRPPSYRRRHRPTPPGPRAKTVPSSSSISTEATESTAPEKPAAEKMFGKAEGTAMLRNNPMSTFIALRPKMSRKFPSFSRVGRPFHPSSFLIQPSAAPRSPQTPPHSPTPIPVLTVSGAAGAKANSSQKTVQPTRLSSQGPNSRAGTSRPR